MNGIYLIIGGNIGKREAYLHQSRMAIEHQIGAIQVSSSIYETPSWGKLDEPTYLNQVLFVYSKLSPLDLLNACLTIEHSLGRTRTIKWESRVIDIDILFYNKEIINVPQLKIPHPFLHQRKFVLNPLNEIAPNFIHPIFKKTIQVLLKECNDVP